MASAPEVLGLYTVEEAGTRELYGYDLFAPATIPQLLLDAGMKGQRGLLRLLGLGRASWRCTTLGLEHGRWGAEDVEREGEGAEEEMVAARRAS